MSSLWTPVSLAGWATTIVLIIHIGAGLVALAAGTVAIVARKGGRLHRRAGVVFAAAMVGMAVFAAYLGFVVPDQRVNVAISAFTAYLVATGWLATRRRAATIGGAEKLALAVGIVLCAPFVILSAQLATGMTPLFTSAVGFRGPIRIAIYVFTVVLLIAAIGDIRLVAAGGLAGTARIARHLWRMCLGLTLAAGSAFTNGFARFLPGPYHVPPAFFMPQLVPIVLLVFWMVRLRLTGRFADHAVAAA